MSSDTPIDLFPGAIVEDRYQGVHSRGAWWAIAGADVAVRSGGQSRISWAMSDGPSGGDDICGLFWRNPPRWIATGVSPDAAVANLRINGSADDPDWSVDHMLSEHPAEFEHDAVSARSPR